MMRWFRFGLITAITAVAGPAFAGPWIDDRGRSTQMMFPGAAELSLSPNGHRLAEGVTAFKQVCLDTGFDKQAAGAAAGRLGWAFVYSQQMMPFKQPVDVGGWNAPDAALRISDGIFFNKLPQCNLTFSPTEVPSKAEIQAAVTQVLASTPANVAKALKKSGEPNKSYEPEWQLSQPDGSTLIVFARPSPTVRNAIHFAVLKKQGKA